MNFLHPCCNHKITDCVTVGSFTSQISLFSAQIYPFFAIVKNGMCNKMCKLTESGENNRRWETIAESNFHWLSSSSVIKRISVAGQVSMIPQINEQNSMFTHSIPLLTVVVTYRRMIVVPFLAQSQPKQRQRERQRRWEGLWRRALWLCPFSARMTMHKYYFQFTFSSSYGVDKTCSNRLLFCSVQ